MAELSGQSFAGYEIVAKLGEGGFGAVYKARQPNLNRLVALKILAPHLAADAEFVARFKREATLAASFNHPNLVLVFAAGESDGSHYMAMEFVEGETLRRRIENQGRLEACEAIAIAVYVAQALQYAWNKSHLIHRDIKPDNIFVSAGGEIKVGDLGLAKNVGQTTAGMTATGMMMGSPHYISPEQASARKDIDFRADIYSLGCTFYHMLTGKPPYEGNDPMVVMGLHVNAPPPAIFKAWPQCPMPLGLLVGKMLKKNPRERHASYDDLIAELTAVHEKLEKAKVASAAPPSGTITFLFTDIEGSTQLWEKHPQAMPIALEQHNQILHRTVKSHGGFVFKTVGDAFCVAFASAPNAMAAALAAQRALSAGPWGETGPLRVRMALHTGAAEERGGDYFGPTVNRVARVLAAGHGGQVLLSNATEQLVRDHLAEGVSLGDLGERSLKNLTRTERIFQVNLADMPTQFPTLRSVATHSSAHHRRRMLIYGGAGAVAIVLLAGLLVWSPWKKTSTQDSNTPSLQQSTLAEQQVERVAAELKRLNPGFDGQVTPTIEGGKVVGLAFATRSITDISPVRALGDLRTLLCTGSGRAGVQEGRGKLKDLSAIQGMKLTSLDCGFNPTISDLSPLKGMPLTELRCHNTKVADLSALQGMPLRTLLLISTPVGNLSPLKGMPLWALFLQGTKTSDLSPLTGMQLEHFSCAGCPITDLSPLKGMRLSVLYFHRAQVTDWSVAKEMPLKRLSGDFKLERDTEVLRSIKTLENINSLPAAEFWKQVEAGKMPAVPSVAGDQASNDDDAAPVGSVFTREVAALPAEQQVQRVAAKLKELNPSFNGQVTPTIEGGKVVGLAFSTKDVSDISPMRALSDLRMLLCTGSGSTGEQTGQGKLKDLSPIQGMALTDLDCSGNPISDLSPLKGMSLTKLSCRETKVADLSALQNMPLKYLTLMSCPVSNLSLLEGVPLKQLYCALTKITDLSPLTGMRLQGFSCAGCPVASLSPLKDMRLTILNCSGTQVADLSVLKDMPLKDLKCSFKRERDTELLRSIKTLENINNLPAAEFWKQVEAGKMPTAASAASDEVSTVDADVSNSTAPASEAVSLANPKAGEARLLDLGGGVTLELVGIPPGEFILGSTKEEQEWAVANSTQDGEVKREGEAPRKATIKQGFWLGRTEVTVGQWKQFVKEKGYVTDGEKKGESYVPAGVGKLWASKKAVSWQNPDFGFGMQNDHPVSCISWNDAVAFCEWLTEQERKAGRLAAGMVVRLPTEAEWEYACRAGQQTRFWWGDSSEDGKDRLNWSGTVDGFEWVSPVDHYGPRGRNSFGLADMLGNVCEWCLDQFDPKQAHEECNKGNAGARVFRGGAFYYTPGNCRCAYRGVHLPSRSGSNHGFRVLVGMDVSGSGRTTLSASSAADATAWQNAINLLPLIDPEKDAVEGKWMMENASLRCETDATKRVSARMEIPYKPPEEYDFRIIFAPKKPTGMIYQVLRGENRTFQLCIGGVKPGTTGRFLGFEIISGKSAGENPSGVLLKPDLEIGRHYTSLVQVRKDGVKSFLDGRLITEWKTDYQDMTMFNSRRLRDDQLLGIGDTDGAVFHRIEVREVTGKGTFTRPAPAGQSTSASVDDAFLREVAALPAEQQVQRVAARLKELNPGYDGQETHKIKDGEVTELRLFQDGCIADISPLRALKQLRKLDLAAGSDSLPRPQLSDLSPLKGMKLTYLRFMGPKINDLSPLRGMPLETLNCVGTGETDLSPLIGMPLKHLGLISNRKLKDLSPLQGMPLEDLNVAVTGISDLSPLKRMRLKLFWCFSAKVADLSVLKDMPIENIRCDFVRDRDTEVLRSIKTLETINNLPAAEFWKQVEAGKAPQAQ